MKKIISLLFALLMILPLAAACGNPDTPENTQPGDTSASADTAEVTEKSLYDEDGYRLDSLPEKLDFGTDITTLMWNDYSMKEFYVEEDSGNIIDSAIYSRNVQVEERLGIKFVWVEAAGSSGTNDEFTTKADADYKSDHLFDVYATYSRTPPALALKGYCANLLSTKYFDIEKPWWPEALTKECTIKNKLYFASGDISTNLLWMMIATFYNRALFENYRDNPLFAKTPEQLVKENAWTMETMFGMCKDIYVDTDANNSRSAGDTFGMVIFETNIDAFQTAAGITSVSKTADGGITISDDFKGQRALEACELTGNFLSSTGCYHTNSTSVRNVFFEERAVFITDRCFIVAGKDNAGSTKKIEFAYGIVPQPKFNADQENFGTNMGHPFTMYAVSSASHDIEASAAMLEAMGSASYRMVTPAVFETTMKVRYADGAEVAEMYDIIRNNVSFDIGRLYAEAFGNSTANLFRTSALSNPSAYATTFRTKTAVFNKGIETVMAAFEG